MQISLLIASCWRGKRTKIHGELLKLGVAVA
jgi:hypothetical protein